MAEMLNRRLICLSAAAFIFIAAVSLFIVGTTTDDKSRLLSFFPPLTTNAATLCAAAGPPLKVYMYKLPKRFNVGMIDSSFPDTAAVTAHNIPPWRWNDGLRRQHSVEYWIMASLLLSSASDPTREAVRVMDPEEADVFFVPFFSSLSLSIHGRNMTDPNDMDRKLQLSMVNILRSSMYWQRSGGRDHVIPMHHPNAFRHYRHRVNASMFIVADFGRIMNISRLAKDVVAPYVHMVESYTDDDHEDPYESRNTLLFFRGRTLRKDEGKVRAGLKKMLQGAEGVVFEEAGASGEGFKASTEGMRSSKFCLHAAGDTPSSCRLFDAIVSHCVPVIVSDKLELPYENELDYKDFSIFFSDEEALKPDFMLSRLRGFPKQKWIKMWSQLKSIAHHFEFQYPPKKDDAVNMIWREVKQKLPAVELAVHRSRRLKIPDWWR